jgi:hypothetical protein
MKLSSAAAILLPLAAAPAAVLAFVVPPQRTAGILSSSSYAFAPKYASNHALAMSTTEAAAAAEPETFEYVSFFPSYLLCYLLYFIM